MRSDTQFYNPGDSASTEGPDEVSDDESDEGWNEDTDEISISASADAGLIVPNISNGKNDGTDTCTTEDATTPCSESYPKVEESAEENAFPPSAPDLNHYFNMEQNSATTSVTTITDIGTSGLTTDRTDEADTGRLLEDASSVKDRVPNVKPYAAGGTRGDIRVLFFAHTFKFW